MGIRDGFDGILFPERYSDGGLVPLSLQEVETTTAEGGNFLGNATRTDPFRVRQLNAENQVEEVDLSNQLIDRMKNEKIDAVISIVGPQALSILFKLHKQGLKIVCVPTSVENDVAATQLSFGFNSALSFAIEMIERARIAAQSEHKIGVVEVLGERTGWLALQAGIATCADAVLLPEVPYDLREVAAKLKEKMSRGRNYGLVVVAEGAVPRNGDGHTAEASSIESLRASLSPGSTGQPGSHVIERSGFVADSVALELQRLTDQAAYPLVLGKLVKGGPPTPVDRQLGLGYGAAAISALEQNQIGVMVSFQPPELKFVPLGEAINKVRTVPANSMFMNVARSLGVSLGESGVRS